MDNHYHLLLETPTGNRSRIMHHANSAYTTYFNVKRVRSGHLFQGRYKAIVVEEEFVSELVGKNYETPLKDVFGSVLLGSQAFIDFIKNEHISSSKANRNVPSLKQFVRQPTLPDIRQAVESVLGETSCRPRKIQIFLCRKLTSARLSEIGDQFGIGDSAVSQSYFRFLKKIEANRHLKKQVDEIEEKIKMCKVET